MKCNDKYYIFNIIEWKENGYYKKIIYLVDLKEEELYKIEAICKEIEKSPSKFFDKLFNKFDNRDKYKDKIDYDFPFLSLLRKNKSNYEYIIIININSNEIYKPNIYKFLLERISMEMSSYLSKNSYITTIIKIYKNGKFLRDFLIFYNDRINKYEILENIDGKIISEHMEYNIRELFEEIFERIKNVSRSKISIYL
ncbi:Uncharacterized protein Nst1_604 [Candidatus Nanobsidianus stetteri]|uniref:Uncharacterized protein n=1 Tax=Nanobsidianus stetteri TaxID=1294122 RepID=R1E463_NANST|nr:Uncharacterized protein Nst1_604 [Candidatus Nanobsidianus stetteri]